jgi:hypothetical protein
MCREHRTAGLLTLCVTTQVMCALSHLSKCADTWAAAAPAAAAAVCLLQVLKKICWYAVLAPSYSTDEGSSSDVATLVATTAAYKQLGDLPLHQQLLTTFTNPEIVRWGVFEAKYGPEITAEVSKCMCGWQACGIQQHRHGSHTMQCCTAHLSAAASGCQWLPVCLWKGHAALLHWHCNQAAGRRRHAMFLARVRGLLLPTCL